MFEFPMSETTNVKTIIVRDYQCLRISIAETINV